MEQHTNSRDMDTTTSLRLLDMPSELVDRVMDFITTETSTTVRRVCKVLDSITFDRFADTHFAHIYCWVFTPAACQRLKDILQNSPRLRARIRSLTLTGNAFEDYHPRMIHVVPAEHEVGNNWGPLHMVYALHVGDDRSVGLIQMHRVLLDIQDLPQDVSVAVDLTYAIGTFHDRHVRAYQATLFSLAMSHTNIHTLTIDARSLQNLEDILAHGRADFLASMSTITSFTCIGDFWLTARS